MSAVSDLLQASRQAHIRAKNPKASPEARREFFQQALDARVDARTLDPDKEDPDWLDDALVRRGTAGQYHRIPGLTRAEVAAKADADLEEYFRSRLDGVVNDVKVANPEILTPKSWKDSTRCRVNCPCDGQAHPWQVLNFDRRRCTACGCEQTLVELIPVERTEAYKASLQAKETP